MSGASDFQRLSTRNCQESPPKTIGISWLAKVVVTLGPFASSVGKGFWQPVVEGLLGEHTTIAVDRFWGVWLSFDERRLGTYPNYQIVFRQLWLVIMNHHVHDPQEITTGASFQHLASSTLQHMLPLKPMVSQSLLVDGWHIEAIA